MLCLITGEELCGFKYFGSFSTVLNPFKENTKEKCRNKTKKFKLFENFLYTFLKFHKKSSYKWDVYRIFLVELKQKEQNLSNQQSQNKQYRKNRSTRVGCLRS